MAEEEMVQDTIEIGGTQMSLAELGGLDTTDIDEVRRVKFPRGIFLWEVSSETALEKMQANDEDRFVINFKVDCLGVLASVNMEEAVKFVGKMHFDSFWIKNDDPQETIGQFKAVAADIGYTGSAILGDIIDGVKKMRFVAPITHGKNKNNPDDPYSNLARDKIRPATPEEISEYAA